MFPRINPAATNAWKALTKHAGEMKETHLRELFKQDADRYKKWAFCFNDTVVDCSKNLVNDETLRLLVQLANECGLREAINAMFQGEYINETENRSVLHVALRNFSGKPVYSAGKNVM